MKLNTAPFNATKNPFVIFDYFDMLEETITELEVKNRPDLIWICDVSGLP